LNPNSLHGFHIHTNPITSLSDLEKTCATCGGHFNPTGQEHGSILNDDPTNRHVGDLINNLKADGNGEVCVDFYDELATLIPTEKKNYTVLGKSLVVHEGTDDLGRGGKTHILPYVYSNGKVRLGSGEDAVESYRDKKLLKGSKVTGNAGGRLACGNIQ
jgi:Cu-Zn family superoxide dismutase